MKLDFSMPFNSKHTLIALALLGAYASASALPVFTLDPSAVGLHSTNGTTITADNFVVSDYSSVRFSTPTATSTDFTEKGFLNVQSFQLGSDPAITGTGLNSTFGLYFDFTGTGTRSSGDPLHVSTAGTLTSLTYTLYGYNGTASFGINGSNDATVSTTGTTTALATGHLIGTGWVNSNPQSPSFSASAGANLTLTPTAGGAAFFSSPNPFYGEAITAFINTPTQVNPFDGGFSISQGGGSVNFASPVPEPETYALMLAGLGVVGWVSKRRRAA